MKNTAFALALLALGSLIAPLHGKATQKNMTGHMVETVNYAKDTKGNTIVDIALADKNFSTLVKALKAADLVDTLKEEGSFTVFAPTNEAFEKLPKGALKKLLNDKEKLKELLTYHVLPKKLHAKDIKQKVRSKTLAGKQLHFTATSKGVKVNNAKVVKPDIEASNGVIHVIDTVLMPVNKTKSLKAK